MDRDNRSWPMRIVAGIWRGLDRLRRLLHLILLLGLFLLLLIGVVGERVLVPDSAALVIAPQGSLVDQLSGDALERAIAKAQGTPLQETLDARCDRRAPRRAATTSASKWSCSISTGSRARV